VIKPLRGKLLVEILSDYKQTKSGIWLAGTQKEIYHYGKVLVAGNAPVDKKGRSLSWPYKEGDIVHFKKYSYQQWRDDDFKIKAFLKRDDILAYERGGIFATNDYCIVKIDFKKKIGSFYVPDNKQQYTADFTGIVVSVGPDCRFGIKEGDEIIILRMEGGGHEGFPVRTNNGDFFAIRGRWIYGKLC
jgi:co-chaperonin GroES (HSP10)